MDELVANLQSKGVCGVHAARAMRVLDRAMFVPFPDMAYVDAPQPHSHAAGRSVVSAAHVHAAVLQLLVPVLTPRVAANAAVGAGASVSKPVRLLDAGCGCGYVAAGLALLAKQNDVRAVIHGTELYDELVGLAISHCRRALDVQGSWPRGVQKPAGVAALGAVAGRATTPQHARPAGTRATPRRAFFRPPRVTSDSSQNALFRGPKKRGAAAP